MPQRECNSWKGALVTTVVMTEIALAALGMWKSFELNNRQKSDTCYAQYSCQVKFQFMWAIFSFAIFALKGFCFVISAGCNKMTCTVVQIMFQVLSVAFSLAWIISSLCQMENKKGGTTDGHDITVFLLVLFCVELIVSIAGVVWAWWFLLRQDKEKEETPERARSEKTAIEKPILSKMK